MYCVVLQTTFHEQLIKIIKLINLTGFNLIIFHFHIRRKLSTITNKRFSIHSLEDVSKYICTAEIKAKKWLFLWPTFIAFQDEKEVGAPPPLPLTPSYPPQTNYTPSTTQNVFKCVNKHHGQGFSIEINCFWFQYYTSEKG